MRTSDLQVCPTVCLRRDRAPKSQGEIVKVRVQVHIKSNITQLPEVGRRARWADATCNIKRHNQNPSAGEPKYVSHF